MTEVLLITFSITLLYIGIVNRLLTFTRILAFQGILLFGISFIELREINTVNLVFILLETIIFKTVAVPLFLNYIIRRNKITRESDPFLPHFVSIMIITCIILASFLIFSHLADDTNFRKIFFIVALATLFTGLYIILTRKKIITHVMGYMIFENGVFILSVAIVSKMPMLVNAGILLDIFASRIGNTFEEMSVENLQNLKD
ncbi:MAG: hypothetical protein NTW49_06735 [Bacteroidia bacterium]|nr:hypothetical protein [Bacteroidia bacterium]